MLIEQVPAGVLRVIVHILLTMHHLAGHRVVVHPLTTIGGNILHSLGHCAGGRIEVIPSTIPVVLTLDYMTVRIVPDPLASSRDLNILIHRG